LFVDGVRNNNQNTPPGGVVWIVGHFGVHCHYDPQSPV
jgi:hypothetical protein